LCSTESCGVDALYRSDETRFDVLDSATFLKHPPLGSLYERSLHSAASAGVLAQGNIEVRRFLKLFSDQYDRKPRLGFPRVRKP
jgi:hypothetical protein